MIYHRHKQSWFVFPAKALWQNIRLWRIK